MFKSFLFKRPDWFKHEGYWRLAQVFRIGLSFFVLAIGIFALGAGVLLLMQGKIHGLEVMLIGLVYFAGAVACVIVLHWLIRLIVWITDGFKEERA